MSSFLIVLIACALYGFLHSLLASLWVKERLHRRFGEDCFRWYRLIYNLIVSLTFVPVLGLLALLPDRTLY
ncbi:MAG: hypothetical protein NZ840_10695, partial [Anaerolineales bacterium]|nr:hypothetical protein [Anaerolineales bacterium]MDW8162508.1 hypothetical protein [Anaerolineales bacterium]